MNEESIVETVRKHFWNLLSPRDKGNLCVVQKDGVILVTIGQHRPFLAMQFSETSINLWSKYPDEVLRKQKELFGDWRYSAHIKSFSKKEKVRKSEVAKLPHNDRPFKFPNIQRGEYNRESGEVVVFDLFEPDSLNRAEFYCNAIITHIKYLFTNSYGRIQVKDTVDVDNLTSLAEFATGEYEKRVLKKK